MEINSIPINQIRQSFNLIYAKIETFYYLIPHDLVRPLLTNFRAALSEYNLLDGEDSHFLHAAVITVRKIDRLAALRGLLEEIKNKIGAAGVIDQAIAEIDFLLTAETLIGSKEFWFALLLFICNHLHFMQYFTLTAFHIKCDVN